MRVPISRMRSSSLASVVISCGAGMCAVLEARLMGESSEQVGVAAVRRRHGRLEAALVSKDCGAVNPQLVGAACARPGTLPPGAVSAQTAAHHFHALGLQEALGERGALRADV